MTPCRLSIRLDGDAQCVDLFKSLNEIEVTKSQVGQARHYGA
jgi:hypothetical protein